MRGEFYVFGQRWCRVGILAGMIGLSVIAAPAATITVSNLPGGIPVPLIDISGQLATGSVRLGTVPPGTNFSDPGELTSSFQQFGESISIGLNGINGIYQNTVTDTVAGTPFSGSNVFTVVSLAWSTTLDCHSTTVVDHGFTFQDEPGLTEDAVLNLASTLKLGGESPFLGAVNGRLFEGTQLGDFLSCPEPSSTLLSTLGLMVCLVRRRPGANAM